MQFQHLLLFCDHPMGPDVHSSPLCVNIYTLVDCTTGAKLHIYNSSTCLDKEVTKLSPLCTRIISVRFNHPQNVTYITSHTCPWGGHRIAANVGIALAWISQFSALTISCTNLFGSKFTISKFIVLSCE